jgi:hypothetical protein
LYTGRVEHRTGSEEPDDIADQWVVAIDRETHRLRFIPKGLLD